MTEPGPPASNGELKGGGRRQAHSRGVFARAAPAHGSTQWAMAVAMDQATALNLASASRFAQSRRLRMASVISARKKGRLRCHKRPSLGRKRPRRAAIAGGEEGGRYRIPVGKMNAISGSIERR